MPTSDFDLAALARYLHLPLKQVTRLAERGKLPGRKVAGQWRFSRSEIHHWLEQRIGASDDEELVQLEGALRRAAVPSEYTITIEALLPQEAIAIPLAARTKSSVIRAMIELATQTGWLWDPDEMAQAVRQREQMYPTAMDNGVALHHPRRPLARILDRPFLALGRTQQGIPFGNPRGSLTDLFFLICSVDDSGHLRTLARLGRLLSDSEFVSELRQTQSPAEARSLIVQRERSLTT